MVPRMTVITMVTTTASTARSLANTHLQEDPEGGTEARDRPGYKKEQEEPEDGVERVLSVEHGVTGLV